VCREIGAG